MGQCRVRRPAHIGLNDRRVDPHRARHKPLLAHRATDQDTRDFVDHLWPQTPGELANRRLVRHRCRQRQPDKPPQVKRIRDLPDQRLIAPASPLLDHHQPHEQRHRDRRTATITRCRLPLLSDRRQQRRIAQQLIQPSKISRQLPHLDRERLIEQRLDLLTHQPQHPATSQNRPTRRQNSGRQTGRHPHLFPGQIATAATSD